MMTTFHIIHILIGAWLAFVNFFPVLDDRSLLLSNAILGLVVLAYNVYFVVRGNVDVRARSS